MGKSTYHVVEGSQYVKEHYFCLPQRQYEAKRNKIIAEKYREHQEQRREEESSVS
jgi:hypothetical protein